MKNYQSLIDQALQHIRSQQSPDGGFSNLSSVSPDDFSNGIPRQTTFFISAILTCLQNIPGRTADVQAAAAHFLLGQKSDRWSFNYWATRAEQRIQEPAYPPYPDDLDDTCAALAALVRHDRTLIDGHAFAAIAHTLTSREVQEGGPYKTWLTSGADTPEWNDVDLVVNSTIGYFLSLLNVRLPLLERFINNAVREGNLTSRYYPGVLHVAYFLSRYYKNGQLKEEQAILAHIVSERLQQDAAIAITPLERAMAITSLINLLHSELIPPAAVDLLAAQLRHNGFLPYAFCIDPARGGKRCYAGASALTAAFCAEALVRYGDIQPPPARLLTTHDHIQSLARASCKNLGLELRIPAMNAIEKTLDERITLLAYSFHNALRENGKTIPLDVVEQLSLANLYGWMAYDIYDDALDGENASSLIPCANFFLRSLTELYNSLNGRITGVLFLFNAIMNRIDTAHAWEQQYCKISTQQDLTTAFALPSYGDYHILADRSIGHGMGPLAQLLLAGYDATFEEYHCVEAFFTHYLIARQLHDDAHDWADDLRRGRVNSIGTLVLQRFQEKYSDANDYKGTMIAETIPLLQKIFWGEIIDSAVALIKSHIASAREARKKSSILDSVDFMEEALRSLESSAHRAARERDEALVFLKNYRDFAPSGASPQNPLSCN